MLEFKFKFKLPISIIGIGFKCISKYASTMIQYIFGLIQYMRVLFPL